MRKDDLTAAGMADGTGTIAGLVVGGHEMLDRHRLLEAEELFYQAMEQSASISASTGEHRHLLAALQGLAEVYIKRGRRARLNDLEHHRMHVHALTAKRRAIECCSEALHFSYEENKLQWFKEQKVKMVSQLKTMEDNIVKSLKRKVLTHTEGGQKKEQVFFFSGKEKVDISWLEKLQEYYMQKSASYYLLRYESREDLSQLDDDMEEEQEPEQQLEVPKPINFEKVQSAIQRIVKKIAKMGTLKIHRDMTPEQKLNLISPMYGEFDIYKTFSRALNGEDVSLSSNDDDDDVCELSQILEDIEPDAKDTMDLIESSQASSQIDSSHNETQNTSPEDFIAELPEDEDCMPHTFKYGQRPSIPFMLTPLPFHDIENDAPYLIGTYLTNPRLSENLIFRSGVYRIWRTDKVSRSPEQDSIKYKPYTLQTYEELSPLTDFVGYTFENKDILNISDDRARFPISGSSLNLSLALALCKMADMLKKECKNLEAAEVYKHALGILKDSTCSRDDLLEPMGHILQQLGLLKCTQGDFVGGSHLMEECIRLYERCDPQGSELLLANAWYELGNAYVGEQWKEQSLFDHIMRTVQEALQVEYRNPELDIPDDMSDSDESSEGESYSISTQEAIVCFANALALLRKLSPCGDRYNKLLVEVLTKLGDCQIMMGNYDTAILHYEEAVGLFKAIVGSATLPNNAHVLGMLGTANFLLTNFPKAISMYECSNLLQKHLHDIDDTTFSMAFTMTMLAICYHSMEQYHKCVAWCIKAFEIYSRLYKEHILHIGNLQRWFVTETLYTLGFSYGTLDFHDKALYYLKLSRNMLHGVVGMDTKQCVRILKAMGDQYVALEDNDNALQFYNEALDLISSMGMERGTTALQNQLLNRMASVHVSTKQYSTAAEYLEQALAYQKNMECSIQDDLVLILRQLSMTYTMSGDIERAIECCQDCIEAYEDMAGQHAGDIADVLARLGTLHHVKACIQEDNEDMLELLDRAETHYQEAVTREPLSAACVQYANYLYQQAQYAEALLRMLEVVHTDQCVEGVELCYSGVEQAVLPENLQPELDDLDQVLLDTKVYARFLALLCYKQLQLLGDAWDCLVELTSSVTPSRIALNHSILGYAMIEMGQYYEAAYSFAQAALLQHDNNLSIINCWICVALSLWSDLESGVINILKHVHRDTIYEQMLAIMPLLPLRHDLKNRQTTSIRDSGYYDPNLEVQGNTAVDYVSGKHEVDYVPGTYNNSKEVKEETQEESWHTTETVDTHPAIIQEMSRSSTEYKEAPPDKRGGFSDKGYYSSEYLERQGLEEYGEESRAQGNYWRSEESVDTLTEIPEEQSHSWHTQEEVVETPAAILSLLQPRQQGELGYKQVNSAICLDLSPSSSADIRHNQLTKSSVESGAMFEDVIYEIEEMQRIGPINTQSHPQAIDNEQFSSLPEANEVLPNEEWVSYAEVEEVETPMAILQVLNNLQAVQTDAAPTPVVQRSPGKTWTETYEEHLLSPGLVASRPVDDNAVLSCDAQTESGEYHSDTVATQEEVWLVEEIEVDTPAAILQEIRRRSQDITHSGDTSPMEISPELENSPIRSHPWADSRALSWSVTRHSSQVRDYSEESDRYYGRIAQSQAQPDRHSDYTYRAHTMDNQDVSPITEEETIWISEETVATPTAILEAINNNGATAQSQHSLNSEHSESSYVRRYGSYRSDPVSYPHDSYRAYSMDTETDIKNGNHISSGSSHYGGIIRPHGSVSEAQDEWRTSEETVETPPEVLQAILRTQRSH